MRRRLSDFKVFASICPSVSPSVQPSYIQGEGQGRASGANLDSINLKVDRFGQVPRCHFEVGQSS